MISNVFHKAMIEVNEQGAEAAAATDVNMTKCAVKHTKPPVVNCKKPFIYSITHLPT